MKILEYLWYGVIVLLMFLWMIIVNLVISPIVLTVMFTLATIHTIGYNFMYEELPEFWRATKELFSEED